MKNLTWVLIVLALVGGLVYFSQNKQQSAPAMMKSEEKKVDSSTQMEKTTKTIEVEAGSFYYKPNTITVKKGEKVKIVMKSVSMMHDFNIDELGVKMPITKNGDTGTVEFTAEKVGSFEYYCSVGKHRQLGQVGTLTVTE